MFATIQRDGKLYRANLTEHEQPMSGGIPQTGNLTAPLAGGVNQTDLQITADVVRKRVRCLQLPLQISIGAGGGNFENSFNSYTVKRQMLMELADQFAQIINHTNFPPGVCNAGVSIGKHCGHYSERWNGSISDFFTELDIKVDRGHSDPDKAALDPYIDKHGLTLTPLNIDMGIGGSRLQNSFNNGKTSFFNYARFNSSQLNQLLPGGPLAETAHGPLRPTVVFFSIGGSRGSYCFDENRPDSDPIGGGTLEAVPPAFIPGLCRRVEVHYGLGGSVFENSFNENGSATILTNDFLDRLTRQIRPSVLAGLTDLNFGWGGSSFKNCAN